jgi:hypothetical protein
MFDATLGRFLQRDSLGVATADDGTYGYLRNNPSGGGDPSGTVPVFAGAGYALRAHVASLVKDLESKNFATRQRAQEALEALAKGSLGALVKDEIVTRLAEKPNLEFAERLVPLLDTVLNKELSNIVKIADEKERAAAFARFAATLDCEVTRRLKTAVIKGLVRAATIGNEQGRLFWGALDKLIELLKSKDNEELKNQIKEELLAIYANTNLPGYARARARYILRKGGVKIPGEED